MRRVHVVLALLSLAVSHPASLAAQAGTIRGHVADSSGAALPRAIATIAGTGARALTDERGDFVIRGVDPGSRTLQVRLIGYLPYSAPVDVPPGGSVTVNVRLSPTPIGLAAIDVVVGSRARHTAAEELAVPVDIFTSDQIASQGTRETSQILQALSPSVNFPHQSVTDANDVVRPFTLRGLSPDHSLVLINGWRRHQMAVVNTFAYGMGAGSSGVDMNAIPASAIDRIEVLRDGASAQYGSDAIAGVVNLVLKQAPFTPFINAEAGQFVSADYPRDGETADVNGGFGLRLGRGSLALFGEVLNRQPTNRAWADPYDASGNGLTDSVNSNGQVVVKRNQVPQPNQHWGDGLERDVMTMANLSLPLNPAGTSEIFAFGGFSSRTGNGQGYRRYSNSPRNWPQVYSLGYLPEFHPAVTDYSLAGGFRGRAGEWSVEVGGSFGHNDFKYNLRNTMNASLGPCIAPAAPCAPGADGILGTADDPGIANQTSFFAGRLARDEVVAGINAARSVRIGLPSPVSVAIGAAVRNESYRITAGERASWIDGGHLPQDSAGTDGIFGNGDDDTHTPSGSQVFPGFAPSDASSSSRTNVGAYLDLETELGRGVLANAAGRFEHYSDFGSQVTGKLALRYQPSRRLTLRAAGSTGFRAPGLGQAHFSKVVTNVIAGQIEEIGVFPVDHPASKLLGSKPLKQETSVNLSMGFALTPMDNVTLTADYFYITIRNRILLGATFADDTTRAILAAGGYNTISGVQYFTNGLNTRTQGLDLTGTVRIPAGTGSFDITGAVNYTRNQITHVDPLPTVLKNSSISGLIDSVTYIAITEERPDWRATVTAQYSGLRLHALGRASYYGRFASAQPGFCDLCRERYGAKTLIDAEVGYRLRQVDLSIGVRNLFDTYPDRPSSGVVVDGAGDTSRDFNNNFGTFPWAAASPFGYNGRSIYARMSLVLGR